MSEGRFGEYELVRKIAAGGMAEIFEAELHGLAGFKRKLAVKRILPQFCDDEKFVAMLLDEARIAARLAHPNIAQVLNCGVVDGSYFIAMEYVDGPTLSAVLRGVRRSDARMPPDAAAYVVVGLLRALYAAHTAVDDEGKPLKIVHRDVSPQNLLLTHAGEVKLVDFGVASAEDKLHKTETGAVKGKLVYMAPEQLAGDEIDHRVDQYAAGLVLFECLTLERVYAGGSDIEVMKAVVKNDIGDVRGRMTAASVPPALMAVVERSLEADPDARFADCQEMAAAVSEAVGGLDEAAARSLLAQAVERFGAVAAKTPPPPEYEAPTQKVETGSVGGRAVVDIELTDSQLTTPEKISAGSAMAAVETPGPAPEPAPRRSGKGIAALALVVVLFGLVAWAGGLFEPASPPPPVVTASAPPPPVKPEAAPDPAPEPPPAPEPKVEVVEPEQKIERRPKPRPRPVARPVAKPPSSTGTLNVACLPWCEITIDGKKTGQRSPLREFSIGAGVHEVEVVNPPTGKSARRKVTVVAGESAKVAFRL